MDASATSRIDPVLEQAALEPAASAEGRGLEFLSRQRSDKEYLRAKNHARRVRRLKIILPIVGVVIMLLIAAAFVLKQLAGNVIDIESIAFEDGKLVMENPNLNGIDKDKRPFSLTADRAIQEADQPKRVELVAPNARLPMEGDGFLEVSAGNGVYDAEKKTLLLSEKILVQADDGMRVEMEDADIDIDAGRLLTTKPIVATSKQADISANAFSAEDSGERLVFEGNVKMVLRPKALREATSGSE